MLLEREEAAVEEKPEVMPAAKEGPACGGGEEGAPAPDESPAARRSPREGAADGPESPGMEDAGASEIPAPEDADAESAETGRDSTGSGEGVEEGMPGDREAFPAAETEAEEEAQTREDLVVSEEVLAADEADDGEGMLPAGGAADGGEGWEEADAGLPAREDAGVVEGAQALSSGAKRGLPPMPRDETEPEPVRTRGAKGHFRRRPAVDEALAELTRPPELSPAEAAAQALRKKRPGKTRAMSLPQAASPTFTPAQRLLLLDTWTRSGLPASDFGALVGVAKATLFAWKRRFEESGPAGLEDGKRGAPSGGKLGEVVKRAILMLKQAHPDHGCERISLLLLRGGMTASASAVATVLREAGYEAVERPVERHPPKARRFEREKVNELWQTDLFTFMLKRQNRRMYLVAFMDDYSRFVVGWGMFSSAAPELVIETLKTAVASYQAPAQLLTDNGPQYVTWRGKSKFNTACEALGIKQIVARPRHPQTLGKVERFWGTLWREFLAAVIFVDVDDARYRIGRFIDEYNFKRPHQALGGLVPAERYLGDPEEAKAALRRRARENLEARARAAGAPEFTPERDATRGADYALVEPPLTPDGSPAEDAIINAVPGPGDDPLTAGLVAAAAEEG